MINGLEWTIKGLMYRKSTTTNPRFIDNLPVWMVIFPEGTVLCEETLLKGQAFAKKNDITDDPKVSSISPLSSRVYSLSYYQRALDYLIH